MRIFVGKTTFILAKNVENFTRNIYLLIFCQTGFSVKVALCVSI